MFAREEMIDEMKFWFFECETVPLTGIFGSSHFRCPEIRMKTVGQEKLLETRLRSERFDFRVIFPARFLARV